jgi:hypothetical protein
MVRVNSGLPFQVAAPFSTCDSFVNTDAQLREFGACPSSDSRLTELVFFLA